MFNRPNARVWLLLDQGLQLGPGWVKTPLLPLIKDNDRDNDPDLICLRVCVRNATCEAVGVVGQDDNCLGNPCERCCLSVDFCLLPGITVSVWEQGTNEAQAILSIDQEHFRKTGWPFMWMCIPLSSWLLFVIPRLQKGSFLPTLLINWNQGHIYC